MMDIEAFRKAGYEAIDNICNYYKSLESRPVVAQVKPGYLVNALPHQAPEFGEDIKDISDDFQKLIVPGLTHWKHPEFFAYFPCGNTFPGIIADLYSSSVSNPCFNWVSSPACTELEQVVMDWAANLLGLSPAFLNTPRAPLPLSTHSSPCSSPGPEGRRSTTRGGGIIQNTASESVLVATIAARERFLSAHPDVPSECLLIYLSTQTHSLGVKGAKILGLNYRLMNVDARSAWGVMGETFRLAYEDDRRKGKWPFIFIGTIGTTSSGANDHIEEIGPIISELDGVWLHIDAAWAGVSFACPEFRRAGKLDAINRHADSFCTNFHKWGLVNIECSAFWVRDRSALISALDVTPSFLRTEQYDDGVVVDYRNWQLSLGRRFRSIKLWFVLRNYGVQGFRRHIRKGVRLAKFFADSLMSGDPKTRIFELVTPRVLGLVVFRLVMPPVTPDGQQSIARVATSDARNNPSSHETLNSLNLALHQYLTHPPDSDSANTLFLTRTELNGVTCLRMAIGAEATAEAHITKAVMILERFGKKILTDAGYIKTCDVGGSFSILLSSCCHARTRSQAKGHHSPGSLLRAVGVITLCCL
ncbi:pyridoxal phosphate-dependent transferase [Cantharellus anzutake]|uniref:pyridoxal phosphate-dependent transferase n=1 Tax=Cantharellus anzutake TaxID=1750568 RepID=UPI001906F3C3|nr:pyridoxal phosphate-dependent transferase [Cantharellus anzutake]KAF8340655.1 pyridoxal phosphate-dependent transferase [Cantharellus anzutake]